ncbi:uncharacterized protein LOC128861517 [Anastrepha ludens]|uniref:uncharacterized protein LOC128861517 n=1 Tax=Anastrepha ludens TaxID=28586 RepID=UPI0023AF2865|nr:uncharacterized protein LOC128861517 [Anastrepha ludens]
MHTYTDGLNYVPFLAAENSRNGVCLNSARRASSITSYNGNYEGDLSMFGSKPSLQTLAHQRRLELVETDSDTEYKRELEAYQPQVHSSRSQLARLLIYYCDRVLTPSRRKQTATFTTRLHNSAYYQCMRGLLCRTCAWAIWLLRLMLFSLLQLTNCNYGCWRSCILLRNTARRLLWWMTLAKCGDMKLFFIILLGTPLVFAVAIVGFLLSIYCTFRERLSGSNFLQRMRAA